MKQALQGIQAMQPHTTRTPANVKNAMTMLAIRHPCMFSCFILFIELFKSIRKGSIHVNPPKKKFIFSK